MNAIDPNPTAKNHRGSRFFSVSISNWLLASNAAFFVLSGLALAASIAIFLLTRANDRAKDRQLRREQFEAAQVVARANATAETAKADAASANERAGVADKEAARANQRAGQLEKQAAETRERAAKLEKEAADARLALESLRGNLNKQQSQITAESSAREKFQKAASGRTISRQQLDTISSTSRSASYKPMLKIVVNGGDEPLSYGREIADAFTAGGIRVDLRGGTFAMMPPDYNIYLRSEIDSIFAKALSLAKINYILIPGSIADNELTINMKPQL